MQNRVKVKKHLSYPTFHEKNVFITEAILRQAEGLEGTHLLQGIYKLL